MGTPERSSFDLITEWLLPGVDPALIERTLALTPTERLEKLEAMMAFFREAKKTNAALPQDTGRSTR
jgi:hypothetical protein